MKNPYEILGVSQAATDDEIKSAYRTLAKKYHPDNYSDNPLADVAEQKMKEINEAYDTITEQRKGPASGGYYQDEPAENRRRYYERSSDKASTKYKNVRLYINNHRLNEAQSFLDSIPQAERSAEWFFLQGMIYYAKGWGEQAFRNFEMACDLEPTNLEYREHLEAIRRQRASGAEAYGNVKTAYRYSNSKPAGNINRSDCSPCSICSVILCADCCCDCLGGC